MRSVLEEASEILSGPIGSPKGRRRLAGLRRVEVSAVAETRSDTGEIERLRAALGERSLVLVGMMGAGKSSVGRRLAMKLQMPFADADVEIEKAAGMTIPEIFASRGESDFRDGERRVIARLLAEGPKVLATGGGAYMSAETRERVGRMGLSVWLKADADVLMRRVRKRSNRPLLKNPDPEGTLRRLIDERYPVYAHSDITVLSRDVPHDVVVGEIIDALAQRFSLDGAAE
ncbi:shikimate kinase [Alsobacter metallidurans]|uniref:Shikimate kinase n=1 Tax=Alsobacter metallidurans TaxID=340221 RepID=A0A917IC00_9HYPH|nr:shikimate kinase [Alsobacter metallidurans]